MIPWMWMGMECVGVDGDGDEECESVLAKSPRQSPHFLNDSKIMSTIVVVPAFEKQSVYHGKGNSHHMRTFESTSNKTVREAISALSKGQSVSASAVKAFVEKLNALPPCGYEGKACTIFSSVLTSLNSPLMNFMNHVKRDYETILHGDAIVFSNNLIEKIGEDLGVRIGHELLHDPANPMYRDPTTWMSNRISLYNPSVNFEHVCMIVHWMITGRIKVDQTVLAPFITLFNYWQEHREDMRFLIYHYVKLIRVNILFKYGQGFKPANVFANLRFGALTDQNIEIYGDTRIYKDPSRLLSMFALTPRTEAKLGEAGDKAIFWNWYKNNTFTNEMNDGYNEILLMTSNQKDERMKLPIYDLFMLLTKRDIDMRIRSSMSKTPIQYSSLVIPHTVIYEDEIQKILLDEMVNQVVTGSFVITFSDISLYKDHKVFAPYTREYEFGELGEVTGVRKEIKTIDLGVTFDAFIKLILARNDLSTNTFRVIGHNPSLGISQKVYTPYVSGSFSMARRIEVSPPKHANKN